jgi:hypothetical protein
MMKLPIALVIVAATGRLHQLQEGQQSQRAPLRQIPCLLCHLATVMGALVAAVVAGLLLEDSSPLDHGPPFP